MKDKILFRLYEMVSKVREEEQKPDMMLVILIVNIVLPFALSLLAPIVANASSLTPLVTKTRTEWEGAGMVLAALIGMIVGVVTLLMGKGWMSLLYGVVGAFLGGSAYGISSCATQSGKNITWTP